MRGQSYAVVAKNNAKLYTGRGAPEVVELSEERWTGSLTALPEEGRRGEMRCLPQERQMESARRPGTIIAFDSDKRRAEYASLFR